MVAFQSHAGSIEADIPRLAGERLGEGFQSHAGSIEATQMDLRPREQNCGFNPTLVRLRLRIQMVVVLLLLRFNPTLVRLRRGINGMESSIAERFNPTLVRLRQPQGGWQARRDRSFQSHAGSIEALSILFIARS